MVNKKSEKLASFICLIVLLSSCATKGRKSAAQIRSLVSQGQYDKAISIVKGESYYKGEESRLLKLLDEGLILHLKQHYYQSLNIFNQAKELSNKLYTKSLSKKVKSFLVNDISDNYYGERYERSFIRYYLTMNHFLLYQKGHYTKAQGTAPEKLTKKEKRRHLQAARASIIEWDSLLDSYHREFKGRSVYKDDMMAKLLGAFIHEAQGSRSEGRIARQLYKDSQSLLKRNYNAYPGLNHKADLFQKDFHKLHKLKEKELELHYIDSTKFSKRLQSYAKENIKKRKKKKNILFVLEEGLISPKKAKKYRFPIGINTLPYSGTKKRDFVTYLRKTLAVSGAIDPYITFELPHLNFDFTDNELTLIIKDREGVEIQKKKMVLAQPLSEIAHQSLKSKITGIKTKVGARVMAKHVVALTASYLAYRKATKDGGNDLFASLIAGGSYALAKRAINQSEQADLRNWGILPKNIRLLKLDLEKGHYEFFIQGHNGKREVKIGDVEITEEKSQLINLRIF